MADIIEFKSTKIWMDHVIKEKSSVYMPFVTLPMFSMMPLFLCMIPAINLYYMWFSRPIQNDQEGAV